MGKRRGWNENEASSMERQEPIDDSPEWDEWDEYEDDGPMDLEDQLDAAFARMDRKGSGQK